MMNSFAPKADTNQDMMAALLDQYMDTKRCRRGDIIKGVIVSAHSKAILIDIGGKCDAAVHPHELERMSSQDLKTFESGQNVNVYVLENNDESNVVFVSLTRAAQENDWDEARVLMRDNSIVSLPVIDVNKGGVIVRLGQLRGFVPGSQLLPWRNYHNNRQQPERQWRELLGETLNLRVIEVTSERNRLILSERNALNNKAAKKRVLEQLAVGSVQKGTISNIVAFGAFVNVNGVDGLLHVSEMSWRRVNNPKEIVQIGQQLDVYILDVDLDKGRLGLSLKRIKTDPWEDIIKQYEEGQTVDVKLVNLTTFGAFAALVEAPEIEGLIHVSELSNKTIAHPNEVVKVGNVHTVRIISLLPRERRIAFSLKQAQPATEPEVAVSETQEGPPEEGPDK